jgi:hypothetical protein
MTKITTVLAVMCILGAYVSYPSAEERRQSVLETLSPTTMAEAARSMPTEAYDAI